MKIKYLKNIFIFVYFNVYFVYSIGINHLNRMAIQHNNGHLGGNIHSSTQTHLNNHFPTTTLSQTNSLNNNFNLPSPTISPFSTINPLSEEQNKQIQHSSPSQTSTLRNSLNQIPSTPLISQSSSTFPQTNNFQPLFTPTPQITKFTKQNVDEQFGQIPTPQTPTIGGNLQKTPTNPQFVEQVVQKDHSTLAPHQLQTHSTIPLRSTEFHQHHQQQQFKNPSITTPTHSQHTSTVTPSQHPSWPKNEETVQNSQNTQVVSPHTSSLPINLQQQNINGQTTPLQKSFLNEGESTKSFPNHQNIPSNTQQNNLNTNLPILNNQKLINSSPFSQNQNVHLANTVIPSQLNSPQNLHQSTNPLLNTNKSPTFSSNQLPPIQPQNNSPEINFNLPNSHKLNSQELISSPSTSKNNSLNKQNLNQNLPKPLFNGRESTLNTNHLTTSTHPHSQNNSQNTSSINSPRKNKLETNSQTLNSQPTSQINSNINTTTLLSTLSSNNSLNSQNHSSKQTEKQNIIPTPTSLFSNQTKNQNLQNNKINESNEENQSSTINNFRNLNNSKEKNHKNTTQINNETSSKQNLSAKEKSELNKNKLFGNNNETSTTRTENLNTNTNKLKENTSNIDKNEFNKFGKIENKNKITNNNLILNTTTTALPTTTLPQKITTTTQDPIIRKELEKVGAPEILKQMVPPKLEPVKLPEIAKKNIESICANRKCLGQKQEFKEQRAVVVKQEQAVELKLNPGKSVVQVQHEVERRVSKTFQLKREILKNKVEPANNGVFQADLLLTEEQANSLIVELQKQMSQKLSNSITKHKTKRAGNAVFMESSPSQRWPLGVPIQYLFDQNIALNEQNAVKEALSEIQSKTCLQFIETKTKPTGAHLYYTKVANPTFCGLSYIGQILPANPIYLSFMCGNGSGIALHETLHALGFQHEQLRFDRDQFITVRFNGKMLILNNYGLRYDYGSIMHYSDTIAAQSPGKKTMTAKLAPFLNDPMMGQRKGLSTSDIEALNKMYCMPGCEDKLVYCGIWASNNLCNPQMWRRVVVYEWIISNCQKSCNKCGEKLEPVKNRPF